MNEMMNWHVVYTKPDCERKVTHLLAQKGIEAYCPQYRSTQKGQLNVSVFNQSLFPRWVFLYCTSTQLTAVKHINGIVNMVYRQHEPAIVSEEDISTIKYVLSRWEKVVLQKISIRLENNVRSKQEKEAHFKLSSLGYVLVAQTETEEIPDNLLAHSTRAILGTPAPPRSVRELHSMLSDLPSILASRITSLSLPKTRRLEQQ